MVNMKNSIWLLSLAFIFLFAIESPAKEKDKVEIKIVSNIQKSGYENEVFIFTQTLMSTSADISNVSYLQKPSLPEGIKIIKGTVKNNRAEIIEEKGKTYYCWTISRDFLSVENSGTYKIGESKFIAYIPHEKVVFHEFWGRTTAIEYEEIEITSKPVTFKVNSLPSSGKEDFCGCIGEFKIEGWFPPGNIEPGVEAYAVFTISGFGSLSNLKVPVLYKLFSSGCSLKEVEQNEQQIQKDGKLFSEITLTCNFMPETTDFEIDPLCLKFFNPTTKKYYNICSEALHWTSNPKNQNRPTPPRDAISI